MTYHCQVNYPGGSAKKSTLDMVNAFLDWAQQQQNGWTSI
jgi:hypothetical protein